MTHHQPLLIVLSAPSGAGKSTLCNRLLAELPSLAYSVSCTTRPPRGAEVDGRDYFFLSPEDFQRRVERGDFLEHATVHDHCYGTLRSTVEDCLGAGRSVLMDIDVAGAEQVRQALAALPANATLRAGFLDLFIRPPSLEELRRRLLARNEDTAEQIELRLRNAAVEMAQSARFRHTVVNDDLERAYAELRRIILESHARLRYSPCPVRGRSVLKGCPAHE